MGNKTKKTTRTSQKTPAEVLKSRHALYKSWLIVSDELNYNKGVLCAVANGRRKPSRALIDRMNERYGIHLPYPMVAIYTQPCQKCGDAHITKRCTRRSTFEDNAAAYDAWLASPETRRKLAAMLEWAETPIGERGKYNGK
jgi:hypothetical protein